jgi:hypothetical protein
MSLIVVYKNFLRSKMVNLSARSVKHFVPDAKIYVLNLYKHSPDDYKNQELLNPFLVDVFAYYKTKFVNESNDVQDHVDTTKTSGYGNPDNGAYFAEGFNLIYDRFRNHVGKLLMLTEDHFFTTGETLREIITNDSPIMFGQGDGNIFAANGSILCINPTHPDVKNKFPLPEVRNYSVEMLLLQHLLAPLSNKDLAHPLSTRKWIDYCGDGIYTNSSEEIEQELIKAGIR